MICRAHRADVLRSSFRICLILVAIVLKSRCFCQTDGISITLLEEDVYCKENFIYSTLFATNVHEKYVFHRKRTFLYLLLLMSGDVEKWPGPTESKIQDLFNQRGVKVFIKICELFCTTLLNYPLFYTIIKPHIIFLSLERTSINQHQHSFLISNKFAIFKKIKIDKILIIVKDLLMCNIIINTFYISDKILSNSYTYDIKRKLQLTTNRCWNSRNTISKKG